MVDLVSEGEESVVVTRRGQPRAVLLGLDLYESMQETIEILSDPETVSAIEEGLADIERGDFITLEEYRAKVARDRGRPPLPGG